MHSECYLKTTFFFRCATVTSVTPGCTMKTDPRDSCCLVEVCPPPTPAPGQTTPVPTIQPLPFTGKVNLPTPSPVPGQPAPSPKPIGKSEALSVSSTERDQFSL